MLGFFFQCSSCTKLTFKPQNNTDITVYADEIIKKEVVKMHGILHSDFIRQVILICFLDSLLDIEKLKSFCLYHQGDIRLVLKLILYDLTYTTRKATN